MFDNIFANGISEIIGSVGKVADDLITSTEEKRQLKLKLKEIQEKAIADSEAQITERWKSDNEHITTRLVRPFIVIWSFVLLSIVMIFDGNFYGFEVKEAYLPILETIVTTVIIAYFGSRGVEKTSKIIKGSL